MIPKISTVERNTTELGSGLRSGDMDRTVGVRTLPFKSLPRPSEWVRLGRRWGMKPETAKDRIYGERGIYQMVAEANAEFIADGHGDRVAFLMAPIDASLMGVVPDHTEQQHIHNLKDAQEDCCQADWIRTHSDAALDAYIKSLASDVHHAEVLLAALIAERDARRAK